MADEIPHLDVAVTAEKYREEFMQVLQKIRPDWKKDDVVFKESPKELNRGLLNTMVRCYSNHCPDDSIMIRILNNTMNGFLNNRSVEVACIKYLHKRDCAPKILATFKTGFCYQFLHGEVLNCVKLREEPIWRRLAEELAKIHAGNIDDIPGFPKETLYVKMMAKLVEDYPQEIKDPVVNQRFKAHLPEKETVKKELDEVWEHALSFSSDRVLTHNDTRAENIVWNAKTGLAKLVDFEGMGYNFRAAELVAHFQRFGGFNPTDYSLIPDEEFQCQWLRVYLEKYYEVTGRKASDVRDIDVRRLYIQTKKFELVYLFMTVLTGPTFEEMNMIPDKTIDMIGMSIDCLREYNKHKEDIMALKMPEDSDQPSIK